MCLRGLHGMICLSEHTLSDAKGVCQSGGTATGPWRAVASERQQPPLPQWLAWHAPTNLLQVLAVTNRLWAREVHGDLHCV